MVKQGHARARARQRHGMAGVCKGMQGHARACIARARHGKGDANDIHIYGFPRLRLASTSLSAEAPMPHGVYMLR